MLPRKSGVARTSACELVLIIIGCWSRDGVNSLFGCGCVRAIRCWLFGCGCARAISCWLFGCGCARAISCWLFGCGCAMVISCCSDMAVRGLHLLMFGCGCARAPAVDCARVPTVIRMWLCEGVSCWLREGFNCCLYVVLTQGRGIRRVRRGRRCFARSGCRSRRQCACWSGSPLNGCTRSGCRRSV